MLRQLRGEDSEMWIAVSRVNGSNIQRVYLWKKNRSRNDTSGVGNMYVIFPDTTIHGVTNSGPGAWDSADFGYGIWNIRGLQAALNSKANASDVQPQVNPDWNATSGKALILNKPTLFSGAYGDLTGKPALFSGSYLDLTNKPTIPNNTNQLINGAGYITGITSAQINSALGFSPYNGTTNPNGYISSFTETDPTVGAHIKSITTGNITTWNDKSWTSITGKPTTLSGFGITDGLTSSAAAAAYKPIGYVPGWSEITGKPTTISGYGITDAFTKTQADLLYKPIGYTPSSSEINTALGYTPYNGATNPNNYITSANIRTQISALANGGITYNSSTGAISQTTPAYNNAPGRLLNTSFQPSTVRPTRVSYTVSIATTLSLLNLNSSGSVALQISSDNSNWVTINSAGISRTLAVSVSVGLNDTSMLNVAGEIPAAWYCRLVSTTAGGGTVAFTSGQEITY